MYLRLCNWSNTRYR